MGLRKLSPGSHEYLTNSVACADRPGETPDDGELLSQYFLSRGYPAGEWYGAGAENLGLSGAITPAQMQALFGEGRHPNADVIEARLLAEGATPAQASAATRLGRRFPQYGDVDGLGTKIRLAYRDYNTAHGRLPSAPIDKNVRDQIRTGVQVQAYQAAHDGAVPQDAQELRGWLATRQRAHRQAVSGYELVFEPDKSVSIAWAMAPGQQREVIAGIVRRAARDALTYAEQNALFTRAGGSGEAQVDTRGLTAALFEHWDSRAGDPHLHIHALISSKVQRASDGTWTAIDGRTLLEATVTVSEFFNSRLRDLFREHGATWVAELTGSNSERPVWRLAAVPRELVRGFSQRHAQFEQARAARIVEFRDTHGREPTPKEIFAIDRQAQYDNRPDKQPAKTLPQHLGAWRSYARSVVGADAVVAIAPGVLTSRPLAHHVDVARVAAATLATVADKRAHFSRWNLEAEAHRHTAHLHVPTAARQQLVTTVVDTVLARTDTLAITARGPVAEPESLRRKDGESVFTLHHATRYTTSQLLAAEADLVGWAQRTDGHRLRTDTIHTALHGTELNAGQQAMVTAFARSGRRVQLALAPAGAGKTTAMRVLTDAWRRTGTTVWAFAPSARAAAELGTAIGARPNTLHALTTALHHGNEHRRFPISRGDLVIVDEAAMAGTHPLHAVVGYALTRGANVRLVGDDQQLTAVEAGGAIRLIAHDVGAVHLDDVVRFRGHDRVQQADASLAVRHGDPAGLRYYFATDRVAHGSVETMRALAHHRWRTDLEAGWQSLLIVSTTEDTTTLNTEARALRQHHGEIDRHGRAAELRDGTRASAGDWIVTRHNDRLTTMFAGKDFVKNGDTWTVRRVHRDGTLTVAHRDHGAITRLTPDYVNAHVQLAYAATIHRVQGMTSTGNAHLLVHPTMTREQVYPGITRAAHHNHLYVITDHHVADQHQDTPQPLSPHQVLAGVLARSGAEPSATELIRTTQAEAESLATLTAYYNYAATYHDDDRYRTLLRRYAPTCHDETGVLRILRAAHDFGHSPDDILARPAIHQNLDNTHDPSAVLIFRISQHLDSSAPPAPTRTPRQTEVDQWRHILTTHHPTAAVHDPQWNPVWYAVAGAATDGVDTNTALTTAAQHVTGNPDDATLRAAVTAELARRTNSEAHHRALPWLSRPDFTNAQRFPGHARYLTDMNQTIRNRRNELQATAVRDQPPWLHALGPRPSTPESAQQWDNTVGLVAAYRETFRITDTEHPLGTAPTGRNLRAVAFADLTTRITALTGQHDGEQPRLDRHPQSTSEPHTLVRRYATLARDDDHEHYRELLARHAPAAVGSPAEPAVHDVLAKARTQGWSPETLLIQAARSTDLSIFPEPAEILVAQIGICADMGPTHTSGDYPDHTGNRPQPSNVSAPHNTVPRTEESSSYRNALGDDARDERLPDSFFDDLALGLIESPGVGDDLHNGLGY